MDLRQNINHEYKLETALGVMLFVRLDIVWLMKAKSFIKV